MPSLFDDTSDEDEDDDAPVKKPLAESHIFSPDRMKEALTKTLKGVIRVASNSMTLENAQTSEVASTPDDVLEVMRKTSTISWEAKLLIAHSFSMKDIDAAAKKTLTKKLLNSKEGDAGMTILCETWRKQAMDVIANVAQTETIAFDYLIAIATLITNCTTIGSSATLKNLKEKRGVDWEKALTEMTTVIQQAIPKHETALSATCKAARNRLHQLRVNEEAGGAVKSNTTTATEKKSTAMEVTRSPASVRGEQIVKTNDVDKEEEKKRKNAQRRREILNSKLQAPARAQKALLSHPAASAEEIPHPPQAQPMNPGLTRTTNADRNTAPWGTRTASNESRGSRQGAIASSWEDQAAKWSSSSENNPWFDQKEKPPIQAPSFGTSDVNPSTGKPWRGWSGIGIGEGSFSSAGGRAEASAGNVGVRNDNRNHVGVHNNQPPADAKRTHDHAQVVSRQPPLKQARYSSPIEGGEIRSPERQPMQRPPDVGGSDYSRSPHGNIRPLHFSNGKQQHRPLDEMHRPQPDPAPNLRRGVQEHTRNREPPRGRGRGRELTMPAWMTQGKFSLQPSGEHTSKTTVTAVLSSNQAPARPAPAGPAPAGPTPTVRPVVDLSLSGAGRGRGRGRTIPAWMVKQQQQQQQQP